MDSSCFFFIFVRAYITIYVGCSTHACNLHSMNSTSAPKRLSQWLVELTWCKYECVGNTPLNLQCPRVGNIPHIAQQTDMSKQHRRIIFGYVVVVFEDVRLGMRRTSPRSKAL